jgi:glycosyltransferase involved in cell wall biosynthesis
VETSRIPTTLLPFEARSDWLVSIGNFRRTKRFEEAIRVLAIVRRGIPHAELVLIGREQDGEYLHELRSLVLKLGLENRVTFRLGVSEEEKFGVLARAKVLTVHSPVEGFGWTIPEAGLYGVPVVGNPGISDEVLRVGLNGERVAFSDIEAYARDVSRLLTDGPHWRTYSQGARRVAMEFVEGPVEDSVVGLLERFVCERVGGPRISPT